MPAIQKPAKTRKTCAEAIAAWKRAAADFKKLLAGDAPQDAVVNFASDVELNAFELVAGTRAESLADVLLKLECHWASIEPHYNEKSASPADKVERRMILGILNDVRALVKQSRPRRGADPYARLILALRDAETDFCVAGAKGLEEFNEAEYQKFAKRYDAAYAAAFGKAEPQSMETLMALADVMATRLKEEETGRGDVNWFIPRLPKILRRIAYGAVSKDRPKPTKTRRASRAVNPTPAIHAPL